LLLDGLAAARAIRVPAPTAPLPTLRLRPLTRADRAEYLDLVRETRRDLDRWCPLHRLGESDDAMFNRQLQAAGTGERTGRAWRRIGTLPDGRIVGGFNLNAIARGLEFEADANWWVAPRFAGQGLATLGVRALLRQAFEDLPAGLGLLRIHAGISADNPASARVAAKAGFRRQPGLRSYLNINNEWQSFDAWAADVDTPRP